VANIPPFGGNKQQKRAFLGAAFAARVSRTYYDRVRAQ
jgi:hypothetical protein